MPPSIRRAALLALGVAFGCDDLSVQVSLAIPDGYAADVRSTTVQILVPPVAEPFDCDQVAFQTVAAATIAASSIQEHTLAGRGRVELSDIPRLGTKLFLAHGFDDQDLRVVSACGSLGEVTGIEHVELVAEPATVVIAPEPALGAALPDELAIGVTDARNRPVRDVEVRWNVTGPAGLTAAGSTTADGAGATVLRPQAPAAPGPAVLDIHARWARDAPPRLAFFQPTTRSGSIALPVDGDPESDPLGTRIRVAVGRVGPAGEMGLAAIGASSSSGIGRRVYVAYFDPTQEPPFRLVATDPIVGLLTIGLARGTGRDRIVTLIAGRWLEIHPDGSTTTTDLPGVDGTAITMVPVGSCQDTAADALLVSTVDAGRPVVALDGDGALVTSPFAVNAPNNRPIAGGCVGDIGGDARRVVVFTNGGNQHTVLGMLGEVRSTDWTTFPDSIGFAPAVGADPPALLGARIAIDGTSVARHRLLATGPTTLTLDIVSEDESTTPSISSAGGNIDGDERVDVVAALDFGRGDEGGQFRVFAALGAEADGERLSAVSPLQTGSDPEVFVADFDDDGVDDILLVTSEALTLWLMGEP